jgi:Zn-dependent protease/CBS domain-containing protein
MKYSFKIGSAWGIPIELHVTFLLLIAAVFFLSFLPSLNLLTWPPTVSALTIQQFYTFALVLFLFIFVVFHELAHSVVARTYGIKVRKIILYPIGGVSEIEEIPDNPRQEWRVAVAGPLTSVILGLALFAVGLTIYPQPVTFLLLFSASGNFILDLGVLNILLGVFNLIPAFPMDGGRVFRALLAERMKYSDATRYAVNLGRAFGIAMIIVGLIFLDRFLLLILVGFFVYIGASEEAEQTIVSTTLAGVRVAEVMQSEVGSVNPRQKLSEALEIMFKNRYHDAIVEDDGEFKGIITWSELIKIEPEQRGSLTVEQMPMRQISVYADESVLEARKTMARERIDLVPVVDKETSAKVMGVLTTEGISNAYEKAKNAR